MWELRRITAEGGVMSIGKTAVFLLLAAFLAGALFACGSSETDKIKDAANTAIESAVSGNTKDYEALYGTVAFSLEPYGVSWECFSEDYFSQVSYSIDRVEKTSTGYTAFVNIKTCEATELEQDLARALEKAHAVQDAPQSTDALPKDYSDQSFTQVLSAQPLTMRDASLQLYFTKAEDGSWQLSNQDVLLGAVLGGFDGRQEGV